ncbi:hypothetical protein CAP48_12350 [Advenella sp. S44]|nr:hypothetical protein CAP48_12350 [Advenella sp. S44]
MGNYAASFHPDFCILKSQLVSVRFCIQLNNMLQNNMLQNIANRFLAIKASQIDNFHKPLRCYRNLAASFPTEKRFARKARQSAQDESGKDPIPSAKTEDQIL